MLRPARTSVLGPTVLLRPTSRHLRAASSPALRTLEQQLLRWALPPLLELHLLWLLSLLLDVVVVLRRNLHAHHGFDLRNTLHDSGSGQRL